MSYSFGGVSLSRAPVYPMDPNGEIEDNVIRTPFDAGYTQTRPRYTRIRQQWGLKFVALTDTDVTNLKAYERTTLLNASASFSWAHPISGTFTVQLTEPIKYRAIGLDSNEVSVSIMEV